MSKVLFTCPRCSGKGAIEGFRRVADGVCFACKGEGKLSSTASALNAAERAGLEYQASVAAARANACTDKQMAAIDRIAMRLGLAPGALVATANGMRAGYHSPEFTKAAVSKAIGMFATMERRAAERLCYSKSEAA